MTLDEMTREWAAKRIGELEAECERLRTCFSACEVARLERECAALRAEVERLWAEAARTEFRPTNEDGSRLVTKAEQAVLDEFCNPKSFGHWEDRDFITAHQAELLNAATRTRPAAASDSLAHLDRLSEITRAPTPAPELDPCDGDMRLGQPAAPVAELARRGLK